jgi:hypothetical protein
MLGFLFVFLTGIAAWKMADFEERNPWPWGLGAVLASLLLPTVMGNWGMASPVVALAGVFAGLWWMRARDERNDRNRPPGTRVVR